MADGRWPAFAERAMAAGFRSVAAIPMRHNQSIVGALNLFNTRRDPFRSEDLRLVQALAHVATIAILQERAVRESALLTEQLQGALNTRVVIEQAKGVLGQLRSVGVDEAFRLLRTDARDNHLKLSAVAREVVQDPTSHPGLTAAPRRRIRAVGQGLLCGRVLVQLVGLGVIRTIAHGPLAEQVWGAFVQNHRAPSSTDTKD